MTEAEKRRAEAIWTYRISQEKVLKRLVEKGIFTQDHADYMSDNTRYLIIYRCVSVKWRS